jgi:endonuclease III
VPGGARAVARRRPARPVESRGRPATPRAEVARRSPGRFKPPTPDRVAAVLAILERLYPDATTALNHENPFQLLIATILSAQCTDERVNLVTPGLFERYPDPPSMAEASREHLEAMIRSTGFFRNKARSIRECSADIVAKHGGKVPGTLEDLIALRGVGRKTANVVLGNAFGIPGLVVDTHVARLSKRLGFTRETDPVKIEFALMEIVPRDQWTLFSHWLILHGRRICIARKPRCSVCPLLPHCPRIGVTVSQ